mgnify:CR=1 FL=1
MSEGYLIIAQNGPSGDYLRMAYALGLSLHLTQLKIPKISVAITPGTEIPPVYRGVFDQIIDIPWGDDSEIAAWKIHNKWKIGHVSPYERTILLDADMLVPVDIGEWWFSLRRHGLVLTAIPHRYDGSRIENSEYREAFRFNELPPVYTTCMYFDKEKTWDYFETVRTVYERWDVLRETHPGLPARISGDLAFAMAAKLTGHVESSTTMRFVHMKARDQQLGPVGEDWQSFLPTHVRPDGSILVGNYIQSMPFHYARREFLTDEIIVTLGGQP